MHTDVNVPLFCSCQECVKEGESLLTLQVHGELDGRAYVVDVLKEHVHMLSFHHTESVIYISLPDSQYMWCRPECKLLKHLYSKCSVKMYV